MNITAKKKFIIIYGFYLSWILSFLYKGPLFFYVFRSEDFNGNILLLVVHTIPIILLFFFRKRWISRTRDVKLLYISVMISFIVSVIFLAIGASINNLYLYILVLILGAIAGISELVFIVCSTGWYIRWIAVKDMFITMAVIILIANTIVSVINFLIYLSYDWLAVGLWLSCCLIAFLLAYSMKDEKAPIERPNYNILLPKKTVLLMMSVFYLFSIGGGVVFDVINPALAEVTELAVVFSLIPYLIGAGIICLLLRKASPSIDYFLVFSIACIIIGLIIFQYIQIDILVIISNFFMELGYGVMDIFMWGLVGMIAYVYNKPYTVVYYTMSANVFGVLTGTVATTLLKGETGNSNYSVSLISLICAVIGMLMIPFIYKKAVLDVEAGVELLEIEQIKLERIMARNDYDLLTEREKEVMMLLLTDSTNRLISNRLYISENTLKKHAKNIYRKLGVKNKKELKQLFD